MKRKKNQEKKLISRMMEHLEINHPSDEFTRKVMDRVYMEPVPADKSEKPLISNLSWIIIGLLISTLIIYLVSAAASNTAIVSDGVSPIPLYIKEIGNFFGLIMDWIRASQETLFWYTIGLVSLFILTLLDRIIRRLVVPRGFLL